MRHGKIITAITSIVFVHFLSATQVIPNPVNPQIGENLWQMNYRQSIAIDDIMDTTTLCCNCDYFITQADIDLNGGGFNITQPGNWCLGENIITSQPIFISNAPGVSFDLKGRTISSTVGQLNDIILVLNCPKAIIKNGTLIGLDLGSGASRRFGLTLSNSEDTLVENMRVEFFGSIDIPTNTPVNNFGFYQAGGSFNEFKNCFATGPFLTGFEINGNNCVLSNCAVSHFSGDILLTIATVPGIGYQIRGEKAYLENCKSIGGNAQPNSVSSGSTGFVIQAQKVSLNNCVALDHRLVDPSKFPVAFPAGIGFYVTAANCEIKNCTSAYNESYGIFNSSTGLVVCNNSVHDNSPDLFGAPDSNLCSLILASSGCDFMITQADIGTGGTYVITQPGKYCLAETVSYANSNAITIDSSNVVLDLNGHPMTRTTPNGSPFTTGAIVCNGTYCIIENGDINSDTMILTNTGTTIRNCKMNGNTSFVSGIAVKGDNCSVVNCEISNSIRPGIISNGNDIVIDSVTIQNCNNGVEVNGSRTVVQNSILSNNQGNGVFSTQTAKGVTVENCIAEYNTEAGIRIEGAPTTASSVDGTVNNCKTRFNGTYGVLVGGANPLKADFTAVGIYAIVVDYNIRVTNNIGKGNGIGDMIMVLDITDPLNIQPAILGTSRLISPQVGICTGFNGALIFDNTFGSSDVFGPISPGIGSNLALG